MTKYRQLWLAMMFGLSMSGAQATAIRLETAAATVARGSLFEVSVFADIDAADEIIGFGFDLDAFGVALRGFTTGPGFADDPLYLAPFSDGDGIRGASAGSLLYGPPVSGADVLLGRLLLEAVDLGPARVGLTADDLSFNYTEGLIPLSPALVNFLPPVAAVSFEIVPNSPVPEASSLAYVAVSLGLVLLRARRQRLRP